MRENKMIHDSKSADFWSLIVVIVAVTMIAIATVKYGL
jgi:hypothetical protein